MTIRAAGVLIIAPHDRALFLKRGGEGDFPAYWCLPGGKLEDGETIEQCAVRECEEETGFTPPEDMKYLTRQVSVPSVSAEVDDTSAQDEVDFTTFVVRVEAQFAPAQDAEHVGYSWAPVASPPEPLHPGVRIALARLEMHELDVAKAIRDGQMTSPQPFENVHLFKMRVTGTGAAYRQALKEYVWRDPSLYLNEDFVARCNGLPVVVEHPPGKTLNTEEFSKRVIGTIILPYIKGEDVMGIAKIYDADAAEMMAETQMSTSPSVVLKDARNEKMKMEDGSALLIEGEPTLLDHLAVCIQGVWDKQGPPTGIESMDAELPPPQESIEEPKPPRKLKFEDTKLDSAIISARMLNHQIRSASQWR